MVRAYAVHARAAMAAIPIWLLFILITAAVIGMLELGYRIGRRTHRRFPKEEKESPVGAFAGAMLGLSAFMLGFTFNIAAERYQTRKERVRDQVNAIQTAYLRVDFLPEADRVESRQLIKDYVSEIVKSPYHKGVPSTEVLRQSLPFGNGPRRLWAIGAENGRKQADSNTVALYIESLNRLFSIQAERAMLEAPVVRLPIWGALCALTFLAVMGVAYQSGIAGSKRSKVGFLLAGSFALVMSLIADLDRVGGYIKVPTQAFEDLQRSLAVMEKAGT
jgi:hypothetical protein